MITNDSMAFPDPFRMVDQSHSEAEKGMTYRQWVAGICMAQRLKLFNTTSILTEKSARECAMESILAADALIKALNQPVNEKP